MRGGASQRDEVRAEERRQREEALADWERVRWEEQMQLLMHLVEGMTEMAVREAQRKAAREER